MTNSIRIRALSVLQSATSHSDLDVHNAIVDLRRNASTGDDVVLLPFLDHEDAMVAAATLYALCHVHTHGTELKNRIIRFARGDSRDSFEMPLQCQALRTLAMLAEQDYDARSTLQEIAEAPDLSEAPMKTAWECLAKLYGAAWSRNDGDALMWDPQSEQSRQLRSRIRHTIEESAG